MTDDNVSITAHWGAEGETPLEFESADKAFTFLKAALAEGGYAVTLMPLNPHAQPKAVLRSIRLRAEAEDGAASVKAFDPDLHVADLIAGATPVTRMNLSGTIIAVATCSDPGPSDFSVVLASDQQIEAIYISAAEARLLAHSLRLACIRENDP